MLTDLQRDIIIKSAEGIQEGMWCKGEWFVSTPLGLESDEDWQNMLPDEIFGDDGKVALSNAQVGVLTSMYRCAEGELMLRTAVLGGTQSDFLVIEGAVSKAITERCERCALLSEKGEEEGYSYDVFDHNDVCMVSLDAFTAGQQWSDIFRSLL